MYVCDVKFFSEIVRNVNLNILEIYKQTLITIITQSKIKK